MVNAYDHAWPVAGRGFEAQFQVIKGTLAVSAVIPVFGTSIGVTNYRHIDRGQDRRLVRHLDIHTILAGIRWILGQSTRDRSEGNYVRVGVGPEPDCPFLLPRRGMQTIYAFGVGGRRGNGRCAA